MNLIIQPYRYALSIAVVAAGFLLMETAPLFWPPIYQNARRDPGHVLRVCAADLGGRHPGPHPQRVGLSCGAALLTASARPYRPHHCGRRSARQLQGLAKLRLFRNRERPGMVSTWNRFTEAQKLGVQTSLAVGLPVPLFLILWGSRLPRLHHPAGFPNKGHGEPVG